MVHKEKILLIRCFLFNRSKVTGFLTLTILILITGCGNDLETVNAITTSKKGPVMSARNIEVVFSDSGKIQAKLYSVLLERFEGTSPYLEFRKGFKVVMYDSAKNVTTTITGNYGKRDETSRIMEAKGNVVVRNEPKNQLLNTEHLIWDENRQLITSDVQVKITTNDKILYGTGLKASESFSWYQIPNVSATMSVKQDTL